MLVNFDSLKTFYNALKQKMKNYRGNWNQNDPTADDYIKNRTHWAEISEKSLLSQMVVTINDGEGYVELGIIEPLSSGQAYFVSLNGIEYRCVARDWSDGGAVLIGNGTIYGDGVEGNAEPFVCDSYSDGIIYLNAEAGKYTISISTIQEVVHQLDKKFVPIPDDVVSEDDLADVAFSGDYNDLYNTPTIYNDVVRYESQQSLTDTQKSQVRTNIGAASDSSVVKYDTEQTLTDEEKTQARDNIGVEPLEDLGNYKIPEYSTGFSISDDSEASSYFSSKYYFYINETRYSLTFFSNSEVCKLIEKADSVKTETRQGVIDTSFYDGINCYRRGHLIIVTKAGTCQLKPTETATDMVSFDATATGVYAYYPSDSSCFKRLTLYRKDKMLHSLNFANNFRNIFDLYIDQDGVLYSENKDTRAVVKFTDQNNIYTKDEAISYKDCTSMQLNINKLYSLNGMILATQYYTTNYYWYSKDLLDWNQKYIAARSEISDICYGNSQFVAVLKPSYAPGSAICTSTDGINWITRLTSEPIHFVSYGNNKFIAIKKNSMVVYYTTDNDTWSYGQLLPSARDWSCMIYANNKFVALSNEVAVYSEDGITWTEVALPVSHNWNYLCYGNGKFVATNNDNNTSFIYSDDGITWSEGTIATSGPIYYSNGIFVTVPCMYRDASNIAQYSYDGITWNSVELPCSAIYTSVTYYADKFVASLQAGGYIISNDGKHWSTIILGNRGGVLTEQIANVIQPYIELTDENIPDTIARVSDIPEAASPMVGATSTTDGTTGTVPAPTSTDSTKFLRGDGTWADVSSSCPIESGVTDILPDKYYTFGTVDSLTINLVDTGDDSKLCEYCFEFIPSENFTGLTITPEPKWAHTIRFIPGMTCQVSILRGIGVMLCA